MEMIGHEAEGMHLPAGFAAGLTQRVEKLLPVPVIPADRLLPVSAVHQVIDRPGILDSQLARQVIRLRASPGYMSIPRTDPFSR
jgi:hypothetical protein